MNCANFLGKHRDEAIFKPRLATAFHRTPLGNCFGNELSHFN